MKTTIAAIEYLEYATYTENFEIYPFKYKTYGAGKWAKTYDEAHELAKEAVIKKCMDENPHLAFAQPKNEVIQVNNNTNNLAKINYTGMRMDVAPDSPFIRKDPDEPPENTPKKSIEEPIDSSFNLIEEINKAKTITVLKVFEKMCYTNEERAAYSGRMNELTSKTQTVK